MGSNPIGRAYGSVAPTVEQGIEAPRVAGSSPALATFCLCKLTDRR